ncbi:MAG: hypothetical protein AAB953_02915 [Patescibacteria group bacterium]
MPCFTKTDLLSTLLKSKYALDASIKRGLGSRKLLQLKKGLYMTSKFYFAEPDKIRLAEFVSSKICNPSYLSLEYVLKKHDLLNGLPDSITCITTKTTRLFRNFLGVFQYSNVKPLLFFGFEKASFNGCEYQIATKAKALFDYLYLRRGLRGKMKYLKQQLFENLGIDWANFYKQDFEEFDQYVWKSNSKKMMKIWRIINEYFAAKDFDKWAKDLLR